MPAQDEGSLGPVENAFEAAIKAAIEAKGWELRSQIGVSGFRIDLGVVHPDHAGVYLAGIECDGATYHGSATARDRDKIRQAVLENLGWTILRIWSTDWFRNSGMVADRIHTMLLEHLETDRSRRAAEKTTHGLTDQEERTTDGITSTESKSEVASDSPANNQTSETMQMEASFARETPMVARSISSEHVAKSAATEFDQPVPNPVQFYQQDYIPTLELLVANIVEREGPIPLSLLGKRIANMHGWQRTGRRISEQVANALGRVEIHREDDIDFLWSAGSYSSRIAFRSGMDRSIRDISRAEIAELYDRHEASLLSTQDQALELARHAGISRLSAENRAYLESCILWRSSKHE